MSRWPPPRVVRGLLRRALVVALGLSGCAYAADSVPPDADQPTPQSVPAADDGGAGVTLGADIKAYFTAPLHWSDTQWAFFGGSLIAIAAAHSYDSRVRSHFVRTEGPNVGAKSDDLEDALPTVAVLGGTWLFAGLLDDSAGRHEAWTMLEAAGLSGVTAYALKFAAGREDPYQTSEPNEWGKGGSSFPSLHSTAAFAVGTVLAESGNDEYRWIRRLLGYGLGVATSYERLRHNAHWLSDTVAGGALGMASAHFAMDRRQLSEEYSGIGVVPVAGGAMLTYQVKFQ